MKGLINTYPGPSPPTTLVDRVWMGWGVDGVLVRRIRAKENPAALAGCGVVEGALRLLGGGYPLERFPCRSTPLIGPQHLDFSVELVPIEKKFLIDPKRGLVSYQRRLHGFVGVTKGTNTSLLGRW
jgi:hypothetical protein